MLTPCQHITDGNSIAPFTSQIITYSHNVTLCCCIHWSFQLLFCCS